MCYLVSDVDPTIVTGLTPAGVSFRNDIVTGPGGRRDLAEAPQATSWSCSSPRAERAVKGCLVAGTRRC